MAGCTEAWEPDSSLNALPTAITHSAALSLCFVKRLEIILPEQWKCQWNYMYCEYQAMCLESGGSKMAGSIDSYSQCIVIFFVVFAVTNYCTVALNALEQIYGNVASIYILPAELDDTEYTEEIFGIIFKSKIKGNLQKPYSAKGALYQNYCVWIGWSLIPFPFSWWPGVIDHNVSHCKKIHTNDFQLNAILISIPQCVWLETEVSKSCHGSRLTTKLHYPTKPTRDWLEEGWMFSTVPNADKIETINLILLHMVIQPLGFPDP